MASTQGAARRLLVPAGALAALATLGFAGTASATQTPPTVEKKISTFNCVERVDEDTFITHFGYYNFNDEEVTVPISDGYLKNKVTGIGGGIDHGQPSKFQSGRVGEAFKVEAQKGQVVVWTLTTETRDGRKTGTTTGGYDSPIACPKPEPQPEPQPEPPAQPQPEPEAPKLTTTQTEVVVPAPAAPATPTVQIRKCLSRRVFTIRIRERSGQKLRSAKVVVLGQTFAAKRRSSDGRLVAKINLKGTPKSGYSININAERRGGQRMSSVRRYRTCIPRKPGLQDFANARQL